MNRWLAGIQPANAHFLYYEKTHPTRGTMKGGRSAELAADNLFKVGEGFSWTLGRLATAFL